MMNRRTLVAGAVAISTSAAVLARPATEAKRRAIDAIELPPSFNGLIAFGRRGAIDHVRCVGLEDREAGRAFTPVTQVKLGSASKWLTSVAVLRLVEQGRLSLDAPITAYLPGFRRETGDRVLLKHLLSNTSGIPDLLSRQLATEPELRTSTAAASAIVARFGGGDVAFAPGNGWDYAALNWAILADIIERQTGERLPTIVERLIFRPLGMRSAGFVQIDQPPLPHLAAAYSDGVPPVRKMAPVPPFLVASGNAASDVGDTMRAAHGIFHGSLLSANSRRELTAVRWKPEDYALGGRVHPIAGEPWAWETGKVGGYRTHIAHRLSRSETVVVFNTTDMAQSVIGSWVEGVARA